MLEVFNMKSLLVGDLIWLNTPLFDCLCKPHVLTEVNLASLHS